MEVVQSQEKTSSNSNERFIHSIIKRCQEEKGLAARLRRADNPATEYQSWELLATYGVDLEKEQDRLPFALIAAAIAKTKIEHNGSLRLGRAIAASYDDGSNNEQAKARLRRLLACNDLPEVCRILRPLLSLIENKVEKPLDYVRLLRQLHYFSFNTQRIKAEWAQEFYGNTIASDTGPTSESKERL